MSITIPVPDTGLKVGNCFLPLQKLLEWQETKGREVTKSKNGRWTTRRSPAMLLSLPFTFYSPNALMSLGWKFYNFSPSQAEMNNLSMRKWLCKYVNVMETMACWATAEAAVIEMACSLIMESIFGRRPSVIKTSVHQAHAYKHTLTQSGRHKFS